MEDPRRILAVDPASTDGLVSSFSVSAALNNCSETLRELDQQTRTREALAQIARSR
jgi:hypothetical protein